MTGRDMLLQKITTEGVDAETAQRIVSSLYDGGYACVPIQPTKEMFDAAWADALGEDGFKVWLDMIYVSNGGTLADLVNGLDIAAYYNVRDEDSKP